jgi:hypothetical protein
LRARGTPNIKSYLKFNVSGLGGASITSARFEIYANGSNAQGFSVHEVSNTSWVESGITYSNAPVAGNQIVFSGSHGGARYVSVDVSSYIRNEGVYSLALTTTYSDNYRSYPSKELGSNPPRLVIETGATGPTITSTPTLPPSITPTSTPTPTLGPSLTPTQTPTVGPSLTPTITPTAGPTPVPGNDLSDALELYGSSKTNSDSGFEKSTMFYGLKRKELSLATNALTDAMLRDEAGQYFKTIHIDAATANSFLDANELNVLKNAIENGGANILIPALRSSSNNAVNNLTNGEIVGSSDVTDTSKDYIVSRALPSVTRELSGLTITHTTDPQDFGLNISGGAVQTTTLVEATNNSGGRYKIFAKYQNGLGSVFVVSNYADEE